jgi:hypothetical protein
MKICTKCNIKKQFNKFDKDKTHKDGLSTVCKLCQSKKGKQYRLENKNRLNTKLKEYYKQYPWKRIFQSIKSRCNNKNVSSYKDYGERGITCLITVEEIKILWFRDKAYSMKKPSIDRIDNDGNYTFENCRFIEMGLNVTERNKRVSSKPILQFDLQQIFIREWSSVADAGRGLKMDKSQIAKCCRNKIKMAYGFIWKYKT